MGGIELFCILLDLQEKECEVVVVVYGSYSDIQINILNNGENIINYLIYWIDKI